MSSSSLSSIFWIQSESVSQSPEQASHGLVGVHPFTPIQVRAGSADVVVVVVGCNEEMDGSIDDDGDGVDDDGGGGNKDDTGAMLGGMLPEDQAVPSSTYTESSSSSSVVGLEVLPPFPPDDALDLEDLPR